MIINNTKGISQHTKNNATVSSTNDSKMWVLLVLALLIGIVIGVVMYHDAAHSQAQQWAYKEVEKYCSQQNIPLSFNLTYQLQEDAIWQKK